MVSPIGNLWNPKCATTNPNTSFLSSNISSPEQSPKSAIINLMKEYGIVDLLTNPVMPGLVKIGMTTRDDIDARLKELYTTGVPVPFECQFACKVDKKDCVKIEHALHTAFAPQRVNANREFFRIQVEQARAILQLFHHDDVTAEVAQEIENDLTEDDKNASKKSRTARPRLNFFEMGINKGSILYWKEDPSITIEVLSEHTVLFNGDERVISRVTQELKQSKWAMAPGNYWLFQDRLLGEIYDETYPFED